MHDGAPPLDRTLLLEGGEQAIDLGPARSDETGNSALGNRERSAARAICPRPAMPLDMPEQKAGEPCFERIERDLFELVRGIAQG